jgi:Flp pilus assembly pilin Flp
MRGEGVKSLVHQWIVGEDGQDLVEYALLAAFVALVCVAALEALGGSLSTVFTNVATELEDSP